MENQQQTTKSKDENSKESNDVTHEYNTFNSNDIRKFSDVNKDKPINKNFTGENEAKPIDLEHAECLHITQNPRQRISQNRAQRKSANTSVKSCPQMPTEPVKTLTEDQKWRRSLNREFIAAYEKLEEYCTYERTD